VVSTGDYKKIRYNNFKIFSLRCSGLSLEHGNVVLLPVKDGMFLYLLEDIFVSVEICLKNNVWCCGQNEADSG
jgi:hypothetical protein